MLHRGHELCDHLARMLPDDGRPEDAILAGHGQHFHDAVRLAVHDRPVEIVDAIRGDLVRDALRLRLGLVEAHSRHFRFGERAPRDHREVGAKPLEAPEQRVDRGVPRRVRRGVGELVRAGHVAAGVDVRIPGREELVHFDGARLRRGDAEFLESVAGRVGHAPHRTEHHVERDAHFPSTRFGVQDLFAILQDEAPGLVVHAHIDALGAEALQHHRRDLGIFAHHETRQHLHLRHLRPEAREALRQFAADGAAAEHQQPRRQRADAPQGVRGDVAHVVDPGDRRHEGPAAGGDDDAPRRQRLCSLGGRDLHGPGRGDLRGPGDALDTQPRIALHRVVGLDGGDHPLDPLHDFGEVEIGAGAADAEIPGALDVRQQLRRSDQRLRWHAPEVEAVAAHPVLLDQRDLGLHRRSDVGGNQSGGAGTDDDQIAVEAGGLLPLRVDLARLQGVDASAGDEGQDPQRRKREDQARRQQTLHVLDPCDLRSGIHIDDGAGKHAHLADPIERPGPDGHEPHRQVDREKRDRRQQSQHEQVERAVLSHARVDRLQPVAEAPSHDIAKQETAREKRDRRADAGSERHDDRADHDPEQRPTHQRHHRGPRQRQSGHGHVDREVHRDGQRGIRAVPPVELRLLALDELETEVLPQIEGEERHDAGGEHDENDQTASGHSIRVRVQPAECSPCHRVPASTARMESSPSKRMRRPAGRRTRGRE